MPAKLMHKQYVDKVRITHKEAVEVIGRYAGTSTKIKHRCTTCSNVWKAQPQNIIHRTNPTGCPACAHPSRKTYNTKSYQSQLNKILPGYRILSKYKGANYKIRVRCSKGHDYTTLARSPIKGHKCSVCHHDYLANIFSISADDINAAIREQSLPFRLLSSTFTHCNQGATFICKNGHRFFANPTRVYKPGTKYPLKECPMCAGKYQQSLSAINFIEKAAKKLRIRLQYIKSKTGEKEIMCGDRRFKLDAYNKKLNLGIEFHGVYYHGRNLKTPNAVKRFVKTILRDRMLMEHVNLYVVWENEWLDNPELVLSNLSKFVDELRLNND